MSALARAAYRVRQFAAALRAELWPTPLPDLRGALGEAEGAIFRRLSRADQRHSVAVWQTLRARGVADPDLLKAALLHDVGKAGADGASGQITLAHRVIHVLLRAVAPAAWRRLAQSRPGDWRHAFYVQEHHAAIGAELVLGLGVPALVIDLVRYHQEGGEDQPALAWRLALLRQADASN